MFRKLVSVLAVFFILSLMCQAPAFAIGAGGFRNEVVSARTMGRGSAGCAQTDDAAAVHYNPAAMTELGKSAISLGYTLEAPETKHTATNGTETSMTDQTFLIPNLYLVDSFGMENFSFGLGVTSDYGLATDWADNSFSKYISTEADLYFYGINPSVAYKVNDKLSVGVGANYIMTDMNKWRKFNTTNVNDSLDDGDSTNNTAATVADGDFQLKGDDEAWSYNLGVIYKPWEGHTIGLAYRSEVDFKYTNSPMTITNLSGLAAAVFGASYDTQITSELNLPQVVSFGYNYQANDKLNVELDVEWTGWSCIKQDLIEWETETNATRLAVLNATNPDPKDWDDVISLAIGFDYKYSEKLNLRCGYLFEETPVPDSTMETALPDSDRHGVSVGFGYKFKDFTVDMAYLAVFFEDRTIDNNVGAASEASIDGEYEQFVHIVGIGFTYEY
ncbi:MAG: outer membrane protein transport protein [Candidatus Omnitrophota bacterium]